MAWQSLVAPAGTPRDLVGRHAEALARVMAQPALRARLEADGFEPAAAGITSEKLAAYVKTETERWRKVIQAFGASVD